MNIAQIFVIAAGGYLCVTVGMASTIQWDGGGDGTNWNNAPNWSGDTLPGATNDVVIDAPGTNITVNIASGNVTVRSLQCRESLTLAGGTLTVTAGASQVDGALTLASRSSLTVRGSNTTFAVSGAAALNGASLFAMEGAALSLPNLGHYVDTSGCCGSVWEAQGSGSVLRLSGLTNLNGNSVVGWDALVRARTGGRVELTNLTDVSAGSVTFYAENTNSLVDLPALTRATNASRILIEARTDAAVFVPLLADGLRVGVTRRSRGQVPTAQFTRLQSAAADGVAMDLNALSRLAVGGSITLLNGGTVNLSGITNVDGASFYSQGGTTLLLAGVRSYADTAGCCGTTLEASGVGSRLSFPALTNFIGNPVGSWDTRLRAVAGGHLELGNVTDQTSGAISVLADGTNSVADFSALQRVNAGTLSLEASRAGTILLPQLTDGSRVAITLRSGGTLPTAQFTALQSATADAVIMDLSAVSRLAIGGNIMLLNGGTINLSSLTNADGVNFYARGGTTLSLPGVRSYVDTAGCCGTALEASGAGSRLSFPALTNLTGNPVSSWDTRLRAIVGGRVELTNCTDQAGAVSVLADGTNSVADLSVLQRVNSGSLSLEARNAGSILVPQLTDGSRVSVTLRSGGTIPTTQFTALQSATADAMAVNFSNVTRLASRGLVTLLNGGAMNLNGVTNLDGVSLSVPAGSTLSLPGVRSYSDTSGCCGAIWEANGAGALLSLPNLTNLAGNPTWTMEIRAFAGGSVNLSAVTMIPDSNLSILADGTNSVMNLAGLPAYGGTSRTLSLTVRSRGTILVPVLARLNHGQVIVESGGSLALDPLMNADGSSFFARVGQIISVSNVTHYVDTSGCCGATWEANGAGAVLHFPGLTNLAGNPTWTMGIRAFGGGNVALDALTQIPDSNLAILADGSNSVVELPNLPHFAGAGHTLALTVQNRGSIQVPGLVRLNRGSITKHSSGVIGLTQLTNIDGSSLYIGVGEQISLPNVAAFADTSGCCGAVWEVNGMGSRLNFPGLTHLAGNPTWSMQLRALAGGMLNLGALTQILDSHLNILAEGTNSVVDLRQVAAFEPIAGSFTAEARLGGVILLDALTRLSRATLILRNTGFFPTAQLAALLNSAVTIDGRSALFTGLTDYRGTTFTYLNGGSATFPPQADLAGVDIDAPATAISGQPLQLIWAVTNRSATAVVASRHDKVSLSTDAAVGNDLLLGEFHVPGGLAPGAVQQVTNTVILPAGINGNRWFVVHADSRHEVFEGTNEANNILLDNQPVVVSAADLVVDQLSAPTNAAFGANIIVSWRVRNSGSVAAVVPWIDAVYLSTNSAVSPGAVTLGTFAAGAVPLAAGATYSRTQTVALPLNASLNAGQWFVVVKTDPANFQPEADENNNTRASAAFAVTRPPLPDLVVLEVSAPASAPPGAAIPVSWVVTNQGAATVSNVWEEVVLLSTDAIPGGDQVLAYFTFADTLPPGGSVTRTQLVAIPISGFAGALRLGAQADSAQAIVESNETNNITLGAAEIQVPATLTLSPSTAQISENASNPALQARVSRNGDLAAPLIVSLNSSDPAKLIAPATVTIPANVASAAFNLDVVPDGVVDGGRIVGLVASAAGFVSASNLVTVLDGDTPQLMLTVLTGLLLEGQGTVATVTREGPVGQPLTVTLANPSPGQVNTPATVTISADAGSASFTVLAVDDYYVEPQQTHALAAAAPGHLGASTALSILDNDLPQLTLGLTAARVSEGAGAGAVTLVITREFDGVAPLGMQVIRSHPEQLACADDVTFAPGEYTKAVPLSPVDDGLIESNVTVTLTVRPRETLSFSPIPPGVSTDLILLDNDGPSLQVERARDWLCAAGSNGALNSVSVQLRRTGNTNAAADAALTADAPGLVSFPASIHFAMGQTTASFVVSATGAPPLGEQIVTLRAVADGYTEAAAAFTLAADCAPDLVISNITVPADGLTDAYFSVSYREQNLGASFAIVANPPGVTNIAQKIFLSADPFPGNDIFLGAVVFDGAVDPYTFLDRSATFRLPSVAGDYWAIVQADGSNSVAEVSEANNFGVSAGRIHIDPAYTATVSANPHSALAGTPVVLSGTARRFGTTQPAPFEIVSLHIGVRGTERIIAALTDANGNYSATFTPLPGEAGTYTVGAAHPGVANVPAQDTFTLLGMKATPAAINVRLPAFRFATQEVILENLGDVPLTGLTASVFGLPAEFSANAMVTPLLAPFGAGSLSIQLGVTADTNLARLFTVRVTSAEGALADVIVTLTAESLRPRLVIAPESLIGGVARGGQAFVEFWIANSGGAPSGPLQVVMPSLPFVNIATPMPMPPLAPGASNSVTLQLAPAIDAALGEFTGNLQVSGGGASVSAPFSFRVLSTNQGALRIEVTDQFTYYAEGAPRVTNALVELRDPSTGVTLASQTNDAAGIALFTGVTEGYYALHVTAAEHQPYRKILLVGAGVETYQEALLTREVVQFIWNVVPTEIGDRTRITIEAVFETVVPLPVVTVEPSVIDLANFPNGGTINLTVTNHGLLAAQQTRMSFSDFDCWKITPLISDIGTLAARSAIVVPVRICRDVTCSRDFAACAGSGGNESLEEAGERNANVASMLARVQTASGGGGGGNCGGGAVRFIVPCGIGAVGGGAPIGVANAGGDCEWHPVGGGGSGSGSLGGTTGSGGAPCDPCGLEVATALAQCLFDFLLPLALDDLQNCAVDSFRCGYDMGSEGITVGTGLGCLGAVVSCLEAAGKELPGVGHALTALGCLDDLLEACDGPGLGGALGLGGGAESAGGLLAAASVSYPYPGLAEVNRAGLHLLALLGGYSNYFGSMRWVQAMADTSFTNWLTLLRTSTVTNSDTAERISDSEGAALTNHPLTNRLTSAEIATFVARWNRTVDYYRAGIFHSTNVPTGQSQDFLAMDVFVASFGAASNAIAAARAEGYASVFDEVRAAVQQLRLFVSQPQDGICARVRLKIDQEAVIARDAFRATLEILNNSGSPLTNIAVDLVVYRPDGTLATTLFGFAPPALNGVTAVDGTGHVNAGASASAAWNILPTIDAAPTGAQVYYVGGSIRYRQDGVAVTVPLALVAITVHPLAQLQLTYFHQRDVLGDDPFTDEIEPSVPYSLAVMVRNTGAGTARRLRITSAQPQIVENEKGLFIDFQIIATEVAGRNLVPSLTADFGDIPPGAVRLGQWLFKSTLQGLFIDYEATFEHLDNLGDPRLSLIQSVEIRELIRVVRAPGIFEDGLPDMLVNDFPDIEDLPDTLYLSDGTVRPVSIVQTGAVSGALSPGNLQITLSTPLPAGWSYLRMTDPGNGQYRLARVLRSDGTPLSVGTNVWTTDRTFVGGGRRPVRENKLHLLDYNSTGSYTLIYESLAPADTAPPASRVAALPVVSDERVAVVWSGEDNAGGTGIAVYDIWVSRDGGTFLPWLQQTTLTGSFYDGLQGHTYAFYSQATDLAGNRESIPTTPDAITSVNLTNRPPALASAQIAINESETLRYTNVVADPDVPPQALSFGLLGPVSAGATLNPLTGVLTWPTSEAIGPTTNVFTVRVSDNGFPSFSATGAVTVVVNEVNRAPALTAITNRVVREGQLLVITNAASDLDLPANTLTFSLGPNAPAGAGVHPATGLFTWRPTEFQGGVTNRLAVIVTDNGIPSLSATQQFNIFVRDTLGDFELRIGSTTVLAGDSNAVAIVLKSGLELSRLDFALEVPERNLSNLVLRAASPEITSLLLLPLGPDLVGISFDFDPALVQTGLRTVSELGFTAVPGTNSAIVPLRVMELSGHTFSGMTLSNAVARDGRVFVVGSQPLLDAYRLTNGLVGLTLHGRPGNNYTLEVAPDLSGSPWQAARSLLQTNLVQVLEGLPATNHTQFWRAREQ